MNFCSSQEGEWLEPRGGYFLPSLIIVRGRRKGFSSRKRSSFRLTKCGTGFEPGRGGVAVGPSGSVVSISHVSHSLSFVHFGFWYYHCCSFPYLIALPSKLFLSPPRSLVPLVPGGEGGEVSMQQQDLESLSGSTKLKSAILNHDMNKGTILLCKTLIN